MSKIDLTAYAPEPLEMTFGDYTITSPVPDARTGKIIKATFEATREAAQILTDTSLSENERAKKLDQALDIEGICADEDIDELVLGKEQVATLLEAGCPPAFIRQAGQFAYLRWAYDSLEVAMAWAEGEKNAKAPKAPNRAQRRTKSKKKKSH